MSSAKYNEHPGLRWSTLAAGVTSSLQLDHELRNPKPDMPYFAEGRALHVCVLQPHLFDLWPVVPARFATQKGVSEKPEAQEWMRAMKALGYEPMAPAHRESALRMADAIRMHPLGRETLELCEIRERPSFADMPGVGAVKECADLWGKAGILADVKKSGNKSKGPFTVRSCIQAAVALHYPGQLDWYGRVKALCGETVNEWRLIFVDDRPPHDVIVLTLDDVWREYGKSLVDLALERYAEVREGRICGQAPGLVAAELPRYLVDDPANDMDLEGLGLEGVEDGGQ